MNTLQAPWLNSKNNGSKCGEHSLSVGSTSFEENEGESRNGDPSSTLFKISRGVSWRNMNLSIDLLEREIDCISWQNVNQCIDELEDGREIKNAQRSQLSPSQSFSNIQCPTVEHPSHKQNIQTSIDSKKWIDSPPRRLFATELMKKHISSMRNLWSKQEPPIPKVIVIVKDVHWTAPTPPNMHKKVADLSSPTSVLLERPKFPRDFSSARQLMLIPQESEDHGRSQLLRMRSSTQKLADLYEI
jgi:hypothetical protein